MKIKLVLAYTLNKKYIIANEKDIQNNAISHGSYLFEGYGKYYKKNLAQAIIKCKRISQTQGITDPFKNGIPFYKDIKDKDTGEYKYTFIKILN